MSDRHMKLMDIYGHVQLEAFDFENVDGIVLNKKNSKYYATDDKSVEVKFQPVPPDDIILPTSYNAPNVAFNIVYFVDDLTTQAYKTDYKGLVSIMKGIKEAIDDFISTNKPDMLFIGSEDRKGSGTIDKSKDKLYQYILIKYLPVDYNVDIDVKLFKSYDIKGLRLYKKDLREIKFKRV